MFKQQDKVTLSAINAINKDEEIIDYVLPLPIADSDFFIPEDIIQLSIFEYHEGIHTYGYEAFKICIGKTITVRQICELHMNNVEFINKSFEKINDLDDQLCYFVDDNGRYHVFAKLNAGDIIVKDIEDMKEVLIFISERFNRIKNSLFEIKNINNKDIKTVEIISRSRKKPHE